MKKSNEIIINVGENIFTIIEDNLIFSIHGNHTDSIKVCVYTVPLSAHFSYYNYDTEINEDTVIMIQLLLNHIHHNFPLLSFVSFYDNSRINYVRDDISLKYTYNIPLSYYSIVFNGETWYENKFGAIMNDEREYQIYRERVKYVLDSEEYKSEFTYINFLEMAGIMSCELINILCSYFYNSKTFGEFFISIPKQNRLEYVRDWIAQFIRISIGNFFTHNDWKIKLPLNNQNNMNMKPYYFPENSKVYIDKNFIDAGVDPMDI